jgi:putative transcriptional regulator
VENDGVDSLQGQLLVASPSLFDPNFRRTVVLVTEHGEHGAAGLVLNRPAENEAVEAVPRLRRFLPDGQRIYVGGPVEPGAVLLLAEFEPPDEPAVPVLDDIGFVAIADEEEPDPALGRRRAFAGYAGWAADQLESELEREDWIVEPARADDIFCPDPDALWSDVLRRKGGVFELVARMPFDPSVN